MRGKHIFFLMLWKDVSKFTMYQTCSLTTLYSVKQNGMLFSSLRMKYNYSEWYGFVLWLIAIIVIFLKMCLPHELTL
jgi:hypothetical protein